MKTTRSNYAINPMLSNGGITFSYNSEHPEYKERNAQLRNDNKEKHITGEIQ